MRVRLVGRTDADAWFRLRDALWPGTPEEHRTEIAAFLEGPSDREICLVAESADGALIGFAELRLRAYAEGCVSSPVGYLEGIYVDPAHRRRGAAAALLAAGEAWARARGCTEMASDRALVNETSGRFHEDRGFEEVERAVLYRKTL